MSFETPPVFSFLPNWQDGVLERLEFLTEIFASETDEEQRRSLRRYPRRTIEASFLRAGATRAALANFVAGAGRRIIKVPLWFDQVRPGALTQGQTSIVIPDLQYRELTTAAYPEGDEILVVDRDYRTFEVASIASRTEGTSTITLTSGLTKAWSAGTRIMPLRTARILESTQFENATDRVATLTIRFALMEPTTFWGPAWGRCSPLFWFKIDRSDAVTVDVDWPAATLNDNRTGRVHVDDDVGQARLTTKVSMHLKGRALLAAYRRYLMIARGRCVRFWQPSFTLDLLPSGPISGGTYFDCLPSGYAALFPNPQDARLVVAFIFKDRRPEVYREIDSVQELISGGKVVAERFYTSLPTPPIQVAALERISFVMPSRFDQDTFEIKHETDAFARATAMLRTQSIVNMPPIDCWVTSQVYPIELVESLYMALPSIGNGKFFDPRVRESMDMEMPEIGDGTLRDLLLDYEASAESLDLELPAFGDGTLRALLIGYTLPDPDEIDMDLPTIGDGQLRLGLISYDEYPFEGLDMDLPTIGDGTLT